MFKFFSRGGVSGVMRRIVKSLLGLILLSYISFCVWQFSFTGSGNSEWELMQEKDGVRVYSQKSPGSELMRLRSTVTVDATLGSFVSLMIDPNACGSFCYDGKVVERNGPMTLYSSYKTDLPSPFKPRQNVVMLKFNQEPVTREVLLEVIATPNKIPRDICCVRVTHKYNTWRVTPVGGGKLNVEFTFDEDFGGNFPSLMINMGMPEYMHKVMFNMQSMVDQDKYKGVRLSYIEEPLS